MTETAWIIIALILTAPLWLPLVFMIILTVLMIIGCLLIVPWLVVLGYWSDKSDTSDKNSEENRKCFGNLV